MKKELKKQVCPYSGEEFIPKRTNQIYLKPEYRVAFNNQKNNDKRKLLAPKNKLLMKAREVLKSTLGNRMDIIVHEQYLRGAGLSFSVFTDFDEDKISNRRAYSVYEFSYIEMTDKPNHIKIFRND